MKYQYKSSLVFLSLASLLSFASNDSVYAQISADGTLSTTVVDNNNGNYLILNGNRQGNNLFHSFQEFSIPGNGSATFENANDIQNIFSRVTGGLPSNLDGLLKTQGSANLFLINPAGIIFGENASLDTNGSFFATTASSIFFSDGVEFNAQNAQTPPILTISVPVGLNFVNNSSPSQITVQGQGHNLTFDEENLVFIREATPPGLSVKPGKTLALLAGQVNLAGGNLLADGGRLEVGAVESGVVSLTPVSQGWQLGYNNISAFGDITLAQKASIDTSSDGAAGEIQVRGKNISVIDGSAIFAFTGIENGGTIQVNASETFEVGGTGISRIGEIPSSIYSAVGENGTGNGSNLNLEAKNFIIKGGAQVGADTFGIGQGGTTFVKVQESLQILGFPSALGNFVQGTATEGAGASLIVETGKLKLADGGQLITGTLSNGQGATVFLKAFELTEITGEDSAISSLAFASGNGGIVFLETPELVIDKGAITVNGEGTGNAGDVFVTANSIRLRNQGGITAIANSGNGGNIELNVEDFLFMRGTSQISTSATANQGNGGNITINAHDGFLVGVPSENSDIKANALGGAGGNVIISANSIFGFVPRSLAELQQLLNTTNPTDLDPLNLTSNDITAISLLGVQGEVSINEPGVDPSQGIIDLPNQLEDKSDQIGAVCPRGVNAAKKVGEFTITGRGGSLPPSVLEPLVGSNNSYNLVTLAGEMQTLTPANQQSVNQQSVNQQINSPAQQNQPIIEAQGWVKHPNGKIELVAQNSQVVAPKIVNQLICPGHT